MHDLHAQVPEPLIADARRQHPHLTLGGIVRYALALAAKWPESAALSVAGSRKSSSDEGQAL